MDQNTIWILVGIGAVILFFIIISPNKRSATQKGPVTTRQDKLDLMNNGDVVLAKVQEVKPKTANGTDYFLTARWEHPQSKNTYTIITEPDFPNYPFPKDLKPFETESYVSVYYDKKDPTRYYVKDWEPPVLIIGDLTINSKGGVKTLGDALQLQLTGKPSKAFVTDIQKETKNNITYYYVNAFWEDQTTHKVSTIASGAFRSSPPVRKNDKIAVVIDRSNPSRYFVNLYPQP